MQADLTGAAQKKVGSAFALPTKSYHFNSDVSDYFFFGAAFFLAGAAVFAGVLPPIKVKASAALNGNWRTEVSV